MNIKGLNFFEKYIRVMNLILSIALSFLFISFFKIIPKNDNYEFILYSLGIIYAYMFFLIGLVDTLVAENTAKKYSEIKAKYIFLKNFYSIWIVYEISAKDTLLTEHSNLSADNKLRRMKFPLDKLSKMSPFILYQERFDKSPKGPTLFKSTVRQTKIHSTLIYFLNKRKWNVEKLSGKIIAKISYVVIKLYRFKIYYNLRLIEKKYKSNLFKDINKDESDIENKRTSEIFYANIEYSLETLEDSITDLISNIETNEEQIENILNKLEDINSKLDDIVFNLPSF